jgi:S-formylglutathione hydrolase
VPSTLTLGDLASPHLPAPVPFTVLTPEPHRPLPLCVLLLGAGGTRDHLADLQPLFDRWWDEGAMPPMSIAVPSPGLDYYLEDPAGPLHWDSFLADDFIPRLRTLGEHTLLAGISGGGFGALKLAFARPSLFRAVAAMQPMREPGLRASDAGARNRLHHSAGGPPQLIGPSRDAALWEANNPANRAQANAAELRQSGLPIYLETAGRDFLNAHDGGEFLHRILWDLDLPHEYHVVRDADHGGPTMRPRLARMFAWLAALMRPAALDSTVEQAAQIWLKSGMQGKPPAGATSTAAYIAFLRARFQNLRAVAAASDPNTLRHLGNLPPA